MKTVDFLIISLCAVQMAIAYAITRKRSDLFDRLPASRYFTAVRQLRERSAISSAILVTMYALIPMEFLVVYVFF
jgi:predicted transcriptional regulator of viral defense system